MKSVTFIWVKPPVSRVFVEPAKMDGKRNVVEFVSLDCRGRWPVVVPCLFGKRFEPGPLRLRFVAKGEPSTAEKVWRRAELLDVKKCQEYVAGDGVEESGGLAEIGPLRDDSLAVLRAALSDVVLQRGPKERPSGNRIARCI